MYFNIKVKVYQTEKTGPKVKLDTESKYFEVKNLLSIALLPAYTDSPLKY